MSRTRRTHTTATEFARGCAASGVMHDAGLCERVRELEREVERLKADRQHHCCNHWHWGWNTSPTYYPTWTYTGSVTTGTVYTTNTDAINTVSNLND